MLIWVIIAHYIADWGLQNEFVALNKGKYWIVMFSHCMIWAGCVGIALQYLGIFSIPKFMFLLIGHWIMDKMKMKFITNKCSDGQKYEKHNLRLLYIDQTWHLAQCALVYYL